MDTWELRSSFRGYLSTILWGVAWILVILWAGRYLESLADASMTFGRSPLNDLIWLVTWVTWIVAAAIAVCILHSAVYGPLEVNTFSRRHGGSWVHVQCRTFDFPFSATTTETAFDRIIKVSVHQSSIDRLIGTGSITLSLVVYTNAEVVERTWTIPAVADPFGVRTGLLKHAAEHTGLDVRIRQDPIPAT